MRTNRVVPALLVGIILALAWTVSAQISPTSWMRLPAPISIGGGAPPTTVAMMVTGGDLRIDRLIGGHVGQVLIGFPIQSPTIRMWSMSDVETVNLASGDVSYLLGGSFGVGTATAGTVAPVGATVGKAFEVFSTANAAVLRVGAAATTQGLDIWQTAADGIVHFDNRHDNAASSMIFRTRALGTPLTNLTLTADGLVSVESLKATGSAGSKAVVCVDTTTGKLYASSTGTDCSN